MTYDPTVTPVPASGGTQPPGRRRSPLKPSQSLCKSELLKNVSIVLFLNKCDELEQKLALGLRVEDFVQLSTKREAGSDVESVKNCECIHIFTTPPPATLLVWLLPSQSANDAPCQRTRFNQPRNGKCSQCECLTDRSERVRSIYVLIMARLTCEGSHLEHRTYGAYRVRDSNKGVRDKSDVHYPPPDFKRLFYGVFTKYGSSNPNRNLYQYFTNITVRFEHLISHSSLYAIIWLTRLQDAKTTRSLIGKGECLRLVTP